MAVTASGPGLDAAMGDPARPEFRDRLFAMYEQGHGENAIARELGRSREWVRKQRKLHGIPPAPRGRPPKRLVPSDATALELIAARMGAESATAGPRLCAARIRSIHDARVAGDALATEDAIVAAAAGLGLWLDQLRRAQASAP